MMRKLVAAWLAGVGIAVVLGIGLADTAGSSTRAPGRWVHVADVEYVEGLVTRCVVLRGVPYRLFYSWDRDDGGAGAGLAAVVDEACRGAG